MDQDHPLGFLVGVWEGAGRGHYPSIEPFAYQEVLQIEVSPKGFLTMVQRTRHADTGEPLHTETGYWRVPAAGRVELVVAHPSGITEICEGDIDGEAVHVRSTSVACTTTAKRVDSLERWYDVEGDVLHHRLSMGAVGLEHQAHLESELRRSR